MYNCLFETLGIKYVYRNTDRPMKYFMIMQYHMFGNNKWTSIPTLPSHKCTYFAHSVDVAFQSNYTDWRESMASADVSGKHRYNT